MTEIQNPKQKIALNQFGIWSLRFGILKKSVNGYKISNKGKTKK